MNTRLFTLRAPFSALLCAAVFLLWARSSVQTEYLVRDGPSAEYALASPRGALYFLRYAGPTSAPPRRYVVRFVHPNHIHELSAVAVNAFTGCAECGYDLRAGPEEGGALLSRCPECGAPPIAPFPRCVRHPQRG